jgi:carboxypeptidase C (cathepsin A)
MFGESFGGHYVPDFASYFVEKNKELREQTSSLHSHLPLKEQDSETSVPRHYLDVQSIGIGNGLTDPLNQ